MSVWISCNNKNMSVWLNKYWSNWMCMPQKPYLFGNKFHTIYYGDFKNRLPIICWVELVGRKYRPQRTKGLWREDNTVGLILQKSRSLWNIRKVVIMDSRFLCQDNSGNNGERCVRPAFISGEYIDEYFDWNLIGHNKTL